MAVLTTLLVSQAGGTSIVMDRIDAEGVAEWIRTERVTTWNGPPALLHSLATADSVAPEDLASLREVWTGGAFGPEGGLLVTAATLAGSLLAYAWVRLRHGRVDIHAPLAEPPEKRAPSAPESPESRTIRDG